MVESRQYQSYADRLASWGYVVLTYDKVENVTSNRNDVVTACFIKDLIDWAASSAALGPITDTSRVLLCGHSRGGKVRDIYISYHTVCVFCVATSTLCLDWASLVTTRRRREDSTWVRYR